MLSYLSCLSYLHVVWTNLTVTAFSIGFIVLSLWIVIFSILSVLKRITKSRTKPPGALRKGMNKEALEAEATRISRELLVEVETCPEFFEGEHHILYRGCVFKPSRNSAALLPPCF